MPQLVDASPRCSVWLFKTISRSAAPGEQAPAAPSSPLAPLPIGTGVYTEADVDRVKNSVYFRSLGPMLTGTADSVARSILDGTYVRLQEPMSVEARESIIRAINTPAPGAAPAQTSQSAATVGTPVSTRYAGKSSLIDLTPFLGDGASVRTSKSVREPAGGFSVTFTDSPQRDWSETSATGLSFESLSGLIEPMDIIEIRMWRGVGPSPGVWYPIVMRGFVSEISRSQAVDGTGKPMRTVTVAGQDWGKIWQTYQVLHLPAYFERAPLLTNFALAELFGVSVVNAMPAGDFVRQMVEKVINPHITGFVPENLEPVLGASPLIKTGDSIAVKKGKVNLSFHNAQGSVYDILKFHGDVGHWNELYTEDREDGIHCVYRPIPALHLTQGPTNGSRKIMEDAPDPIYCPIDASEVESISSSRGDAGVVNFFWVNNARFDLIDDVSRRLFAIGANSETVSLNNYPNSSVKFYGIRPMYAESQQGEDGITNMTGGLPQVPHERRSQQQVAWLDLRRQQLMDMNRDNVVLERGAARVKGCPMRPDGSGEVMKAGDYARFTFGSLTWDAYVHQVDHEFVPYQGYTTTLVFDRGEGFQRRMETEGSPWLLEQTSRRAIP